MSGNARLLAFEAAASLFDGPASNGMHKKAGCGAVECVQIRQGR